MPKITIELSETVYSLLEVLTKGEWAPAKTVHGIIETLIDHAQQGVYRPGAWERQWLEQVFPEGWQEHLEPGDPYGRPNGRCFSDRKEIAAGFKEVALGDEPDYPPI
jgi:hypothetical protein